MSRVTEKHIKVLQEKMEAANSALGYHPDSDTNFAEEISRLRQEGRDLFHKLNRTPDMQAVLQALTKPSPKAEDASEDMGILWEDMLVGVDVVHSDTLEEVTGYVVFNGDPFLFMEIF